MRYILFLIFLFVLSACAKEASNTQIVPANSKVSANLGVDKEVIAGELVTLSNNSLESGLKDFSWTISKQPDNSEVTLSGATTETVNFTPVLGGIYEISLNLKTASNTVASDSIKVFVLTQLTNNSAYDGHPYYNSDGSKIAFESQHNTGSNANHNIWVMDSNGENAIQITANSANDRRPDWSPDDTQLVFHSNRLGNNDLYIKNSDGSGVATAITTNTNPDSHPVWHPSHETHIIYQSPRQSNLDIRSKTVGLSTSSKVVADVSFDGHPMWSPDGSQIAFGRRVTASANMDIWIMNADGTNQRNISNTPDYFEQHAAWSPDGSQLAFRSDESGNVDVWVINIDGSGKKQITQHSADDRNPTWRPDGKAILFRSDRTGNEELFLYPLE